MKILPNFHNFMPSKRSIFSIFSIIVLQEFCIYFAGTFTNFRKNRKISLISTILLIFVINVLVLFFKRIKYSIKSYPNEIAILLPSICGVIVSSLFASALFYYSSPATIIFWLFLGYLICKKIVHFL